MDCECYADEAERQGEGKNSQKRENGPLTSSVQLQGYKKREQVLPCWIHCISGINKSPEMQTQTEAGKQNSRVDPGEVQRGPILYFSYKFTV